MPSDLSVDDFVVKHVAVRFGVAVPTVKLLAKGGRLLAGPDAIGLTLLAGPDATGRASLTLLASTAEEVDQASSAKDLRIRGFEDEERLALQRRAASHLVSPKPPSGPFTFRSFAPWDLPGLQPPPAQALALLHRLAADPGIAAVMTRHKWTVGQLSEMPPEGKVGVSPVCILGVNINQGQEISLRLRTDDLRGFRK